ncbi:MAG TPA: sugar phosphate isomerase/epimerase family protein [Streptosporangiaceae bacterium]
MSYRLSCNSATESLRLSVQEQLVPGDTLQEKFEAASALGYQGIEVRSRGEFQFREREAELLAAAGDGVVISSACVDMQVFIGDLTPSRRAHARENLKSQLGVIARCGGAGVVAPASYGLMSRRLPPYVTPRSQAQDLEIIVAALTELGQVAEREGAVLFLEPLNRYEDFILNTLAQGIGVIQRSGAGGIRLCADFYHMNIEEADVAQALVQADEHVGHVHVSDSNRHEPGAGHADWLSGMGALVAIGYAGWLALECRPSAGLPASLAKCHETIVRAHSAVAAPGHAR